MSFDIIFACLHVLSINDIDRRAFLRTLRAARHSHALQSTNHDCTRVSLQVSRVKDLTGQVLNDTFNTEVPKGRWIYYGICESQTAVADNDYTHGEHINKKQRASNSAAETC
jgi:hypothetical protein